MNFKRGRAKNQRSGCLFCKPHKMNGAKDPDTLDVVAANQPETGSHGNKTRRKPMGPRAFKISCRRCGLLIETRICTNRREVDKAQNDRFRAFCVECNIKLKRDIEEEQARIRARI